jgi:hypothetical protein
MEGNLTCAVKCFFKCPACTFDVIVSPAAFRDPRVVYTIREFCPDVELGSYRFYAGFFLAVLFVFVCALAYFIFFVLRVVPLHQIALALFIVGVLQWLRNEPRGAPERFTSSLFR